MITPRIPSEPISIRSGEGPAPEPGSRRLSPLPARGDRPHRLDQVVDVGVERREVAAGAGRDPAAERRVLERLREVAQREAVLLQLLLERAGRCAPPGSARRARPGRPRARGRGARRSSETEGRSPSARLDAADDAGAAAEGDRPPRPASSTRRAPPRRRPRLGVGDEVGRARELAAEAADDVAVGLAERVGGALVLVVGEESPTSDAAACSRGARSSTSSQRHRVRDLAAEAEPSRGCPSRQPRRRPATGCWSS